MKRRPQAKTVNSERLSVIIIARDEADRIGNCLDSVTPLASEIIVLDSGSTDETPLVCRRFTEQVYVTDWPGYGPQKQRALEKARCEWVLSIDADEALSPELREEILSVLESGTDAVGFKLPWAVHVFGVTLKHGRGARAPLRLFRRQGARFSDDIVHEKVLLPAGKVRRLRGRLMHYTHRDFGHYLAKNREYAWLGAQRRYHRGNRSFGLSGAALKGVWTFFLIYILKLGFLDGRVGFLVAVMYAQSSFNKYAGLWTLRRARSHGAKIRGGGKD